MPVKVRLDLLTSTGLLLIVLQHVSGIPPPDFQSSWMLMVSQSDINASRTVEHGLGEVPIKVKVLTRAVRGPYEGWMFEAVTCQQADDDLPWTYYGVSFFYDDVNVYMTSPSKNNGYDGGRAFCIDSSSWTSGSNTTDQVEEEVLAKVLAWKESSFPVPDFDSGWIYVAISEVSEVTDVDHGLNKEPTLVELQIRSATASVYAEGIGAGSMPPLISVFMSMTGLLFAYNNTHVRVWSPNKTRGAGIIGLSDGYPAGTASSVSGEFRIRCWKSFGSEPQQFSFVLTGQSSSGIPDMSALKVNIRQWDPLRDYISVQVRALDGPNRDFVFGAIGQGQRNAFPNSTYGGVRFGYSKENIAIFVPADESGSIIHVPGNWGPPEYNQMSDNVEITVKMWNATSDGMCTRDRSSSWTFPKYKYHRSCDYWIKCSALCLGEPNCVGFIPSSTADQCQLMDLSTVNNRTLERVLGNESEALLRNVICDSMNAAS